MENKDRITPIDVEHIQFDKTFRGYNEKQVDEFLDKLAADYEEVIHENVALKREIESLRDEAGKIRELEQTMQKTIITAQKASENLIESTKNEVQELKRKKDTFIMEFKNMLKTTLEYLEKMETKLDKNFEDELISEN